MLRGMIGLALAQTGSPNEPTNRAGDWLRQAERDLEHAADAEPAGRHEWACVAAQQAAEKAVKALHLHLGQDPRSTA